MLFRKLEKKIFYILLVASNSQHICCHGLGSIALADLSSGTDRLYTAHLSAHLTFLSAHHPAVPTPHKSPTRSSLPSCAPSSPESPTQNTGAQLSGDSDSSHWSSTLWCPSSTSLEHYPLALKPHCPDRLHQHHVHTSTTMPNGYTSSKCCTIPAFFLNIFLSLSTLKNYQERTMLSLLHLYFKSRLKTIINALPYKI